MDFNDDIYEEASGLFSSIRNIFPKRNEIIFTEKRDNHKSDMVRLGQIHAEAKGVFPKCFIGTKMNLVRGILNRVKISQQYSYGKPKNSCHLFTDLLHKETDTKGVDGLLIDSSGTATATYTENLGGMYELRITSKIRDLIFSETELILEKSNLKSIGSLCCSMRDVDPSTFSVVTQLMYKLLPELSMGTEIGFKPLIYTIIPDISLNVRYDTPNYILSSTFGSSGFQLCFFKQFSQHLRLATIFSDNSTGETSTIGLGLHKTHADGSETKIFIDSQRCGGVTYQRNIFMREAEIDIKIVRIVASALIDRERRVKFGFGFDVDL